MDAAELARIAATLIGAIAEASARAKEHGIDPQFRVLVRHAREMHDLLVEALVANEPLQSEYLSGLSVTAENASNTSKSLQPCPMERCSNRMGRNVAGPALCKTRLSRCTLRR